MPNIKLDPIDEILITIINDKSIYGLDNKFDSDCVEFQVETANKENAQQYVYELNLDTGENELEFDTINIDDCMSSFNTCEKEQVLEVCLTSSTDTGNKKLSNVTNDVCKKFRPEDLQLPMSRQLKTCSDEREKRPAQTQGGSDIPRTPKTHKAPKRRATGNIKTLTSSDISAKYNILLDKRLDLINKQNQSMDDEQDFLKKERKLKLELLTLKIASERSKLKKLQN